MNHKDLLNAPSASLLKQLISMLYDSLLILSVLFIATAILLPFNHGEAIAGPTYTFYLLMIVFIFYGWFWKKNGQTLGMKVWKIRVINAYGYNPNWPTSFLRLCFALLSMGCFGLGYLWRLFKPYTWHDHLSQTRVVDVSKIPIETDQNTESEK